MVHEVIMGQGSWDLNFREDTPLDLWNDLDPFGNIVITPQEIGLGPEVLGDRALLSAARYAGPLLRKWIDSKGMHISGAGMAWWLADEEGKGQDMADEIVFTADDSDTVMDGLLPVSIRKGTIDATLNAYTATHQFESRLEAIRAYVAQMGAEFRVNPTGYIDVGQPEDVYNIDDPRIVVVRRGSGGDPHYIGVNVRNAEAVYDAGPLATAVQLVMPDADNQLILVEEVTRFSQPAIYYDIWNNLIDRTFVTQGSGNPVEVATALQVELNEHSVTETFNISTEFFEIVNGDLRVGDNFYCWDPPAFVHRIRNSDVVNNSSTSEGSPIVFRDELIWPMKMRLIRASWPISEGMGVYYRIPAAGGSCCCPSSSLYIDLTNYVLWEADSYSLLTVTGQEDYESIDV